MQTAMQWRHSFLLVTSPYLHVYPPIYVYIHNVFNFIFLSSKLSLLFLTDLFLLLKYYMKGTRTEILSYIVFCPSSVTFLNLRAQYIIFAYLHGLRQLSQFDFCAPNEKWHIYHILCHFPRCNYDFSSGGLLLILLLLLLLYLVSTLVCSSCYLVYSTRLLYAIQYWDLLLLVSPGFCPNDAPGWKPRADSALCWCLWAMDSGSFLFSSLRTSDSHTTAPVLTPNSRTSASCCGHTHSYPVPQFFSLNTFHFNEKCTVPAYAQPWVRLIPQTLCQNKFLLL